jgi:hypothetical protein
VAFQSLSAKVSGELGLPLEGIIPSKIPKEELPLLGNFHSKPNDWCSKIFDEEWKIQILVNLIHQGSLDAIRGRLVCTIKLPD